MLGVPRPALALGLAGLIPFLYGAFAASAPDAAFAGLEGPRVLTTYGLIIFAYMSGCLWGFAAAKGRATWVWMGLAVAPAVVVFLALAAEPDGALGTLLMAFPALLIFDFAFWRANLAPRWWMTLRLILTAVVTLCLYVGANA
ncbi:MAG: DUF3429 domain-containing protein [Pseudomonadota bacterium]